MGKLIDETGNRYGQLTVIGRGESKSSAAAWLCRCDCGKEITIHGIYLRRGGVKSCGCSRQKGEIGSRYGRLTVIKHAESKSGKAMWLCRCDCGNEKIIAGQHLRNNSHQTGGTKSCGCLQKERASKANSLPLGKAAFNALIMRMKNSAKTRNHKWDLTKDQVRRLTSQPCYYCGAEPSQGEINSAGRNGIYIYNGLDRMDNSKGYFVDNVVPACRTCNVAKNSMTTEQFQEWLTRAYKHYIEKSDGHSMV